MWKPAYNLTRSKQPALSKKRRGAMRNYWKELAARRQLAGLTTRGTVPKRRLEGRILRAEIDAAASAIAEVFNQLPPTVQAQCIELASLLSALRKKTP